MSRENPRDRDQKIGIYCDNCRHYLPPKDLGEVFEGFGSDTAPEKCLHPSNVTEHEIRPTSSTPRHRTPRYTNSRKEVKYASSPELLNSDNACPNFEPGPNRTRGGCFVATAIYQSYNSKQVLEFRKYRDDVLSKSGFGRHFIKLYYSISPAIADFIRDKRILKLLIKTILLDPIFRFLQSRNKR